MEGRPETAAAVLEASAHYLDLGDKAFATLMEISGNKDDRVAHAIEGKTVQQDLRMIAAWLREHPDVDAQIHAVLDALPGA